MVKGRHGERVRSKSNQYPNTTLLQIEGVNTKAEVAWYAAKRMAYTYKAKVKKNGSHHCYIWGKVTRPHGDNGIVRAKFKSNIPSKSMGARGNDFPDRVKAIAYSFMNIYHDRYTYELLKAREGSLHAQVVFAKMS